MQDKLSTPRSGRPLYAKYYESLIFQGQEDGLINSATVGYGIPKDRQEILFGQYILEKKGKKFNKLETRTFKIEGKRLMQVDKKGLERELTDPVDVTGQVLSSHYDDWNEQQCGYRLLLEFDQRANVYIYFNSNTHCRQIQCFLVSKVKSHQKGILIKAYLSAYKKKIIQHFISQLHRISKDKNKGRHLKKRDLINKISNCYSNTNLVKHLLYQWHSMTKVPPAVNSITQKSDSLHHHNSQVDSLSIQIQKLSYLASEGERPLKGAMKIWIDNFRWPQQLRLCAGDSAQFLSLDKITTHSYLDQQLIFDISCKAVNTKDKRIEGLNIFTSLQFQLETEREDGDGAEREVWRSQRLPILNLIDSICSSQKCCKAVSLNNGSSGNIQLIFLIRSLVSPVFNLQSDLQQLQEWGPCFSPTCFPIFRQIIPKYILSKHLNTLQPEHLMHSYSKAHNEFVLRESIEHVSFTPYRKLFDMLRISAIIDRIYQAQPFNEYVGVQCKGTFVYEYLVQKSEGLCFYDAEKFIWKYQCHSLHRFLGALKAFDERPKINFTDPFYKICVKCLQISKMETEHNSLAEYFCHSLLGYESMAFFLVLGILKIGSPLLLYQPVKETLVKNSLLFHYMLKHEYPVLYQKILKLQLNIQALFGVFSVSLFSDLVGRSAFIMSLELLIQERKQHISTQQTQTGSRKDHNPHFLSLVCMFLSILSLVEDKKNESVFLSAEHFIEYLRYYCQHCIDGDLLNLKIAYYRHYQICTQNYVNPNEELQLPQAGHRRQQQVRNPIYHRLLANLLKFTHENQCTQNESGKTDSRTWVSSMRLGEILEKLYSTLLHYKHKNEGDIRKIWIRIDQLQLGVCNMLQASRLDGSRKRSPKISYTLTLSVYQISPNSHSKSKEDQCLNKLYEHQLFNLQPSTDPLSPGCYFNLKHSIELKLVHLNRLFVVVHEKTESNHRSSFRTFVAMINLRELPSNYYLQRVSQLEEVSDHTINLNGAPNLSHLGHSIQHNSYLMHELYIKDSCETEYINSMVPEGYINHLLLKDRIIYSSSSTSSQPPRGSEQPPRGSDEVAKELEEYEEDIKNCNHYFDKYHNPQSNLNLLYSRLGWYGNHYLIPDERVLEISTIPNYSPDSEPNPANKKLTTYQLAACQQRRISQILFFTRCVYGRGLLLKSMLKKDQTHLTILHSDYGGVHVCGFLENSRGANGSDCNSDDGELLTYTYNNFDVCTNFVKFYWKSMKELPLIRYLGFRTSQFSVLKETRFRLLMPVASRSMHKSLLSVFREKIIPEGSEKMIEMSQISRFFEVMLVRPPDTPKGSQSTKSPEALPFLTREDISKEEIADYSHHFDEFIASEANKSDGHIGHIFTFIYCAKFMYADEFMYWLRINIGRHYVKEKEETPKKGSVPKTERALKKGNSPKTEPKKGSVPKTESALEKEGAKPVNYNIKMREEEIPNIELYSLYQVMAETDYEIELEVGSTGHTMEEKYQHPVDFRDYGFVGQKWKPVHILAQFRSPQHLFYYVEQKYTRNKILLNRMDVIVGHVARTHRQFEFTDEDVLQIKQRVRQEMDEF